jgi:DnaJ-class molecular chaperone
MTAMSADAKHPLPTTPALETRCQACDGSGGRWDGAGCRQRCQNCGGTGVTPTEFGKQLIEFVGQHCGQFAGEQ